MTIDTVLEESKTFTNNDGHHITTNDPNENTGVQQVASADVAPQEVYGVWEGLMRDGHIKHFLLYMSLLIYILFGFVALIKYAGVNCQSYYNDCPWIRAYPIRAFLLFMSIYCLYLLEAFRWSSTFKYLKAMNETESIIAYLERIYNQKPRLIFHMQCYHYQPYTTYQYDSYGNRSTIINYHLVVTWTGQEEVIISKCEDRSIPINIQQLQEYRITKVKLTSSYVGDDGYEHQKRNFIYENRKRDGMFLHKQIDLWKKKNMS